MNIFLWTRFYDIWNLRPEQNQSSIINNQQLELLLLDMKLFFAAFCHVLFKSVSPLQLDRFSKSVSLECRWWMIKVIHPWLSQFLKHKSTCSVRGSFHREPPGSLSGVHISHLALQCQHQPAGNSWKPTSSQLSKRYRWALTNTDWVPYY